MKATLHELGYKEEEAPLKGVKISKSSEISSKTSLGKPAFSSKSSSKNSFEASRYSTASRASCASAGLDGAATAKGPAWAQDECVSAEAVSAAFAAVEPTPAAADSATALPAGRQPETLLKAGAETQQQVAESARRRGYRAGAGPGATGTGRDPSQRAHSVSGEQSSRKHRRPHLGPHARDAEHSKQPRCEQSQRPSLALRWILPLRARSSPSCAWIPASRRVNSCQTAAPVRARNFDSPICTAQATATLIKVPHHAGHLLGPERRRRRKHSQHMVLVGVASLLAICVIVGIVVVVVI